MSIKSSTFGSVSLSGEDARKFKNQVRYSKPKAEAIKSVQAGLKMVQEMDANGGRIKLTLKRG